MSPYTKKIYDAVHGFIRFNELERDLIDSAAFQRLHYLRQLGISFLVYPGATHTRFEHSLGAMELTTKIFDRVLSKYDKADLVDVDYWRQILRLAALCHDLGHLPFSHVAEKVLLGKGGHEKWTLAVIQSPDLLPIWQEVQKRFPEHSVIEDLAKMAIGEIHLREMGVNYSFSAWDKVMCQVITGDFFGSDRIDYLLRDAQFTGVSYGLFDYHQLIEMLCIVPSKDGGLELGIEENGIESCEALLLARHFMHQRVYQYPTVKSYSFHLARFMAQFYENTSYLSDLKGYLSMTDNEILTALRHAAFEPTAKGHIDAAALLKREHRFLAIEAQEGIGESEILAIQEKLNIPQEAISWNVFTGSAKETGLAFPVLNRRGNVMDASRCSKIVIPSGMKNWVYIAPCYEQLLREALEC
ncbi:MAG: HD domain-containing protein [Rhabdochlamydiaceae bacterium]|nr:HD domain-containing protein [Rhabdochlamydiaceae bacterium]